MSALRIAASALWVARWDSPRRLGQRLAGRQLVEQRQAEQH
jgi:hypothetical protein